MTCAPPTTTSSPAIDMRRATPGDAARLAEFYREHFASRPRLNDAALWNWEFAEQPGAREHVPFFVLDAGDRIEGGIGYVRFDWRAGTDIVAGIHPVNYFVNPKLKGLHSLRLFRAALNEAPVVLGSYVSDDAMRLVKRSGFIDLSAHFYGYHFSLRIAASAVGVPGKLRNAAVVLSRRVWMAGLRALVGLCAPNIRYQVATTLDSGWLAHAESWRLADCGIVKSATYLAWRYAASPALNCRYVWQLRGNKPIALAILHLDPAHGDAVLLDCIAANDDFWHLLGLISRTISHSRESGAGLWTTHALSPVLERVLRTLGCGRNRSPFGVNIYCADEKLRETITDPRRWHFMIGDTDVY